MAYMQPPRLIHWGLIGFLSIAWGFSFSLIAVGLESLTPLALVSLRLVVGASTLYVIMRLHGYSLPSPGPWWPRFLILACMGNSIPFMLISWAETRISSSQAGLLMALMPISTILLAHFYIAGDVLTGRRVVGVTMGLLGVIVLIGGDVLMGMGGRTLLAQLAVLTATVTYAINTVYTKRLPQIETLVLATGALVVAAAILLPVALIMEQPQLVQASLRSLLAIVVLGVVSTALATWAYFRVVTDCGPSFLAIINYIIPAMAFAAGVLFLGEQATPAQFMGLGIVLMGIFMTQHRHNKQTKVDS